jgi:hypothetical protein
MRRLALLLILTPAVAHADVVILKGGRRVSGVVMEKTARAVVLEVGPGRMAIPLEQVEGIENGLSPLAEYRARAASLGPGDASGWAELGRWARNAELLTQSREAFETALAIDPSNAAAHSGLGHVLANGVWLSEAEAYRARGYVRFDGRWVTPSERAEALEERESDARDDAARRAEARARAAEERAEAAEAAAQRAADEAQANADSGGIPYGWVAGGYGYGWGAGGCGWNCGHAGRPQVTPHRSVTPAPAPAPPTPPAPPVHRTSNGATGKVR